MNAGLLLSSNESRVSYVRPDSICSCRDELVAYREITKGVTTRTYHKTIIDALHNELLSLYRHDYCLRSILSEGSNAIGVFVQRTGEFGREELHDFRRKNIPGVGNEGIGSGGIVQDSTADWTSVGCSVSAAGSPVVVGRPTEMRIHHSPTRPSPSRSSVHSRLLYAVWPSSIGHRPLFFVSVVLIFGI